MYGSVAVRQIAVIAVGGVGRVVGRSGTWPTVGADGGEPSHGQHVLLDGP